MEETPANGIAPGAERHGTESSRSTTLDGADQMYEAYLPEPDEELPQG